MSDGNVSLTISKEVVAPIVESKIKQAIVETLGGKEEILEKVINEILTRKVDEHGKIPRYSSDKRFSWIDIVLTNQIKKAVEDELKHQVEESSKQIKEALIAQIRTKSGSNKIAKALIDGLNGTFSSSYTSKIDVYLNPKNGS